MNRRAVGTFILGAWLVGIAWLVRREYWHSGEALIPDVSLTLPPGASFYTLSMNQEQIGFASTTIDTVEEGIRLQDVMVIEIPALGEVHRTDTRIDALLSRSLSLRTFSATLQADDGRFTVKGEVLGDSALEVHIDANGERQQLTVDLERPIVLPAIMPMHVALGGTLRIGNTYTISLFDPILLQDRSVDIAVVAESTFIVPDSADSDTLGGPWFPVLWDTVHAWQIEQRRHGLELRAWIDDLGRIVQASTPLGFTMERSVFEIAYENFRRRTPSATLAGSSAGDVIRQTAIASAVRLAPDTVQELRVLVGGVNLEGFDLDGGRQVLVGDTITITREVGETLRAGYRLPTPRTAMFREYLASEPLIQVDDPRIGAQARQIIGRTRNPVTAARRLNDWVHQALEKEITISVPSALQVLERRRGDCNEHTVLYVALARALGLPARTAAGLVYVDGRFYYHAWPEVYLGEWVAVDPTFGQFPADASHIRFTLGGLARQTELIRLIGRVSLDVLQGGADA